MSIKFCFIAEFLRNRQQNQLHTTFIANLNKFLSAESETALEIHICVVTPSYNTNDLLLPIDDCGGNAVNIFGLCVELYG